jgi:hypothetical protein
MANSTLDLATLVHRKLKMEKARRKDSKSPWLITSTIPKPGLLAKLLDVVYYTSLKTEEARPVSARLCLVNPDKPEDSPPPMPRLSRWQLVALGNRLPLTVPNLVKIAKAADPWASALAVYFDKSGELYIWGMIDQVVHWNRMLVREGTGYDPPGLLNVVANGVADISVYHESSFLARLQQDVLVEEQNDVFWQGPVARRLAQWSKVFRQPIKKKVTSRVYNRELLGNFTFDDLWIGSLCRILISIQRYRHGGAILITDQTADLFPHFRINYDRLPKHLQRLAIEEIRLRETRDAIGEIMDDGRERDIPRAIYLDERIAEGDIEDMEESLTGTVHFVASLSCVDGLILMKSDLRILGYGVEIRSAKELERVRVSSAPKIAPHTSRVVESNHFGTRHRSMMRYCYAHPSSLGFVVSQDGDIRAVMRVRNEIVLWDNLKVRSSWFENWMTSRSQKKRRP